MKGDNKDNRKWDEPLPTGCPPQDAIAPTGNAYFRLVDSVPPTDRDFWSQRRLFPEKAFRVDECTARACSLISDIDRCVGLLKLPTQKNRKVVAFTLRADSGLIKDTGKWYHYSWWRAKGFDPLPFCTEIKL